MRRALVLALSLFALPAAAKEPTLRELVLERVRVHAVITVQHLVCYGMTTRLVREVNEDVVRDAVIVGVPEREARNAFTDTLELTYMKAQGRCGNVGNGKELQRSKELLDLIEQAQKSQ